MYGMNNSKKLFSDKLTYWIINESVFNKSQYQMYINYKYAPDGSKLVVLYYVEEWVYWYIYDEIVKWFVDKLGNRFHVRLLGYAHF